MTVTTHPKTESQASRRSVIAGLAIAPAVLAMPAHANSSTIPLLYFQWKRCYDWIGQNPEDTPEQERQHQAVYLQLSNTEDKLLAIQPANMREIAMQIDVAGRGHFEGDVLASNLSRVAKNILGGSDL